MSEKVFYSWQMGYDGKVACERLDVAAPGTVREGGVRMPEDLLLELETAPSVAGSIENIEDLMRVALREVRWAVESMKGSALTFEKAWRRIIMEVAKGQTTEIQAIRPRLLRTFE